MRLSDLKNAGDMARRLIEATDNMNTIKNKYEPEYIELLGAVQAVLGPTITLGTMTAEQVNAMFFAGVAPAETVATAQAILERWERAIVMLVEITDGLPGNDL